MKYAIFSLVLAICCQTSFSAENFGFGEIKNLSKDEYTFKFVNAQPAPSDTAHWMIGRFKFQFKGESSIQLWGFGFEEDGSFRTRFEGFSIFRKDKWKEYPIGYCGTGAEMFTLEPNKEYIIVVPLKPFEKDGTQGVVKIDGDSISFMSEPFELTKLRNKR